MLILDTNGVLNTLVVGWENRHLPTRRHWTGDGTIDTEYDALRFVYDIDQEEVEWGRLVEGQPVSREYNGDSETHYAPFNEDKLHETLIEIPVGTGLAFMDHDRCDPCVELLAVKLKDDCWVYNNRHRFYNK